MSETKIPSARLDTTEFTFTELAVGSGSATTPSYSFTTDQDTGIYRFATNSLGFATNATAHWAINSIGNFLGLSSDASIQTADGSVGLPSHTFANDSNNGMYLAGTDSIGFSTSSTAALVISSDQRTRHTDGSAALPSISFISDTDTGIYRDGSDSISFSTNGVQRLQLNNGYLLAFPVGGATSSLGIYGNNAGFKNEVVARNNDTGAGSEAGFSAMAVNTTGDSYYYASNQITEWIWGLDNSDSDAWVLSQSSVLGTSPKLRIGTGSGNLSILNGGLVIGNSGFQIVAQEGTAAAPGFTFAGATTNGMYRAGTNQVGIATGGSQVAQFNPSGSADNTVYFPFSMYGGTGFGGSGQNASGFYTRTTPGVGSSPTIISPTGYGWLIVNGINGVNIFTEFLVTNYNATPVSLGTKTQGTVPARTYALSGDNLTLSLPSGTWNIGITGFTAPIR